MAIKPQSCDTDVTICQVDPIPVCFELNCENDSVFICSNFEYAEDNPHNSGDIGAFVLAVRNDSGGPLAGNGDYIPFTTDASGALRVTSTGGGGNLSCATDSVTICPGDDPIPVTFDGSISVHLACDTDSVTICPGDDPIAVIGTVTATQGTSPWVVGDGGGSLTVDAVNLDIRDLVFATDKVDVSGSTVALDAGTLAALETITVLQGTSPWVIGDGGGSITVDGTVTVIQGTSPWVVSGTVTADTNFDYPEDSVHVSGDVGAFVLAVRNDAGTPLAGNGDYIPFTTDSTGALRVTSTGGGSVTQTGRDDTDNQAAVATGLLTSVDRNYIWDSVGGNWDRWTGAVTQGTSPWVVSGTVTANQGTSPWVIGDGGGSITVDGTVTVTQGTSPWVTSLDAATLAALESITVQNPGGAGAVNIQDGGNSITVDGSVSILGTVAVTQSTSPWVVSGTVTADTNFDYPEDSAHVSGDVGAFVLAVRNDAGTPLAGDGDYIPFTTDASGSLRVTIAGGSSVTQTGRDDTDNQAAVATGLLTSVDRNYIWDSVGGNWDRWTGAVTQGTSPWVIGDGGGSITVDGTVTVTQGTSPWVTSLDAATLAALESITVQNPGGAGAVNIQDGGNSITVDGTVSVSGTVTVDTNFDYAEDSAHVSGDVGAFVLAVRNDANTAMTSTNGDYSPVAVNANGAIAINDGGNSITVDGTVAATQSGAWSVTVLNGAGAAAVNIQDGGNSITVDGTVTVNQGTSPWVISGTVTADTNFDYPEDSVHVSGDVGAFVLAVRNDSGTPLAGNGDYIPFTTDSTGALRVTGGSTATVFQHEEILCDDGTPFVRKYIQDAAGTVTSVVDFDLEGDPYVVVGTVGLCSTSTPVTPESLDSTIDRLTGVGSINISSGAKSVTIIVYAGNPTVTIDADPAVTLVPGMSLSWAVDDRTESLLNAFVFTGTATSDFVVFTTSGPLEPDVIDSTIQRLTGAGSVVIAAGASSTTVTVISGAPTVQIGAGPVIALTPGMSLSWSVDSDNEDLLDAFTFTGIASTDFVVTSTRI